MQIRNDGARKILEEIYNECISNHDYRRLEDELNIRVERDDSDVDCVGYVLLSMGLPADQYSIQAIEKFGKRVSKPGKNSVVMYYLNDDGDEGGQFRHIGKYTAGKVVSKWDKDHLVWHKPEQVLPQFGNEVRFYDNIDEAIAKIHMNHNGIDSNY